MSVPPSVKSLLPSLKTDEIRGIARLAVADLRRQFPSLNFDQAGRDVTDGLNVTLSMNDLRKLLRIALTGVEIDERWYIQQVPGLEESIRRGQFASAAEHYLVCGYLEGRLPQKPKVDEDYYFRTYPDVANALKAGKLRSAYEHFLAAGYAEGRQATQPLRESK